MDRALTDQDLQQIEGLPEKLGAFSIESLFVHYSFTFDELLTAVDAFPSAGDAPEPLKTVVHEATHLFHTTTTPFGFLIYALRRLQAILVARTINDLRRRHIKIRYPLVAFARRLPAQVRRYIRPYLAAWYAAEVFIGMALGDFGTWAEHLLKNPLLAEAGGSPAQLFALIQRHLVTSYRDQARDLRALLGDDVMGEAAPPFEAFEFDLPGDADCRQDERNFVTMQALMNECNMIFVTESAATTSESWRANGLDIEDFWTRFRAQFDWRGSGNMSGMQMLRGAIPTRSIRSFVLSYLALCELSLFGPVLPQHRHLRPAVLLRELLPFGRWVELVNAATKVRPMEALEDFERYTEELSATLNWVSPKELVRFTATSHVAMENDIHESMYVRANQYRQQAPWVFHDYDALFRPQSPAQIELTQIFNFPVIQYADRTLYHRNKALLGAFTRYYLIRAALRAILLRNRIVIRMPYRPRDEPEVAFLRDELLGDLEGLIGIRVTDLVLV
jgi:hypothetical protein